jgi:hypothetical protein
MDRQTSFWKIIWNDYTAYMSFIWAATLPVMFLVMYFVGAFGDSQAQLVGIILGAIFLIAIFVLVSRLVLINRVFTSGVDGVATVVRKSWIRYGYALKLQYSVQGETFTCRNTLHNTAKLRSLPSENVAIVIDDNNYKRVFIRDLFLVE